MKINWEKYKIDISKVRGGKMLCPECSHTRKHSRDLCLSVDVQKGVFNCHNCDFHGSAIEFQKKEYTKPVARLEKVGKEVIEFFEKRGISNDTLLRMKITEAVEYMPQPGKEVKCICFNYFRSDELVNIKFRGPGKSFKMSGGAELIFYNLDSIKNENEVVIVEGEPDCLALVESGIYNVVSVPNGASKGSLKLEYLDNCWQEFEGKTKIILAVDNDEPGKILRDELARRFGKENCYSVSYPDGCKDINDVLLNHGKQAVKEVINAAQEFPLDGIAQMEDMYPVASDWYLNGYPKGAKARIPGFDDLLSFVPGQLTIVTSIPGHGKNEFVNKIMASLAKYEDWPWGICEFEEAPTETVTKLAEKFTDKAFDFRKDLNHRMSPQEFEYGIGMVDRYFFIFNTEDPETNLDKILEKAEQLVRRKGIKGFCLGPWNWLENLRDSHISETEHISQALSKIVMFAKKSKIHFFLIAHTTKMSKGKDGRYEIPTLYNISGSANFFNKTHNGITIYRDYSSNNVDVYVQKVKQSWLGKLGFCSFQYNTFTREYNAY